MKHGGSVSLVLKDVNVLIIPRRKEPKQTDDSELGNASETAKPCTKDAASKDDGESSDEIERNDPFVTKEHEIQTALHAELLRLATTNPATTTASSQQQRQPTQTSSQGGKANSRSRSWQFWFQERLADILENLTVTVQNIHVRYEDPGSCLGFVWQEPGDDNGNSNKQCRPSFCVGLTLKQFTIHSIQEPTTTTSGDSAKEEDEKANTMDVRNSKGTKASSQPSADTTGGGFTTRYKRAAATDLAVYWNSGTQIMSQLKESDVDDGETFYEQAFLAFQSSGQSKGSLSETARTALFGLFPTSSSHSNSGQDNTNNINTYVLHPFSPSITFVVFHPTDLRPNSGVATKRIPPSTIEARLPPCRVTVSRDLVEDLGYLRKSFAIWAKARHYDHFGSIAKMRPTISVHEDPGAWWRYAVQAILAMQRCTNGEKAGERSERQQARDGRAETHPMTPEGNVTTPQRRSRHGWHALANAILDRQRYVVLYREFVRSNGKDEVVHERLLEMEQKDLRIEEIVAFRIHAARQIHNILPKHLFKVKGISREGDEMTVGSVDSSTAASAGSTTEGSIQEKQQESSVLSTDHRFRMFAEIKQTLVVAEGGRFFSDEDDDDSSSTTATANIPLLPFGLDNANNRLSWTTHISCPEVSLQVNDKRIKRRHRDVPEPVVRLIFAVLKEQRLFLDGSWEVAVSIGSLHVEDRTTNATNNPFPNLLGPKHQRPFHQQQGDDCFDLDGTTHICSGSLKLRRSQHGFRTNEFGSTTWTEVRVLPLEICYFTAPVEALVRILNTANLDFAYDYHRLGVRIYEWRERQRKRLLAALSHEQKAIFVQVDVGAPTILLPDKDSLLIVDLGQLTFGNDDPKRIASSGVQYDDHWRLELSSIQVQCTSIKNYTSLSSSASDISSLDIDKRDASRPKAFVPQQIIEPFSLIFAISTKFQDDGGDRTDSILVRASLPRLAFNISSSAIRLGQRLRQQWDERQLEIRSSLLLPSRVLGGLAGKSPGPTPIVSYPSVTRKVEFNFEAPLLRFKCENDIDGRDCNSTNTNSTPLVDLAFRGIEGSWKSTSLPSGQTQITSEAKLRGVDCVDLYQGAGVEFSLLLSSIAPESVYDSENRSSDRYINSTDLVSINFESSINGPTVHTGCQDSSRLEILFHELFVEWNAETIAAIHKAVKKRVETVQSKDDIDSQLSDEFFDTEEEAFYDAGSVLTDASDEEFTIPEISSPQALSGGEETTAVNSKFVLEKDGVFGNRPLGQLPPNREAWISDFAASQRVASQAPQVPHERSFEIVFDLSKLRVNFNKESRHRRVVSAEMDRTSVLYSSRQRGGYMAKVTLGNFVLSDADSVHNTTLYREIVGLKTDVPLDRGKQASLLQMSIVKNPRERKFASTGLPTGKHGSGDEESVTVDVATSNIQGCDISFSARFSPMRFVFLQQLWFEVIDFFFEGIAGYEVWGNKRPDPVPESELVFAPYNAHEFAFTRFDVSLDAPVILVPVSYCSTDFLKIETDQITVGNRYDFRPLRTEEAVEDSQETLKQQWYNNCSIEIVNLVLSSWSGRRLDTSEDSLTAHIDMNWPSGPTAFLNKPKWKVSCRLDRTEISLLQEDYALIQHVVASNLGEGSRHLDEWDELQNLPPLVLERYKEDIMVDFGYDKKDVTPTTFDVSLTLPCLKVSLLQADRSEAALIHCFDLAWKYWKHSDLISRQLVVCQVDISRREKENSVWLLTGQDVMLNGDHCDEMRPSLTYKSIFRPSAGIERSVGIGQALIHIGYPSWNMVSDFFSYLPPASFISPENVIQVGDRWYKIAGTSTAPREPKRYRNLTWITAKKSRTELPSQQRPTGTISTSVFRLTLSSPQIALEAGKRSVVLGMETAQYVSQANSSRIERDIKAESLRINVRNSEHDVGVGTRSPLEIAGITAKVRHYNSEQQCTLDSHSTLVDIGPIKSTFAYSDINIASEVFFELNTDIRAVEREGRKPKNDTRERHMDSGPVPESLLRVRCESIVVILADDWRVPEAQDLLCISLDAVAFSRRQSRVILSTSRPEDPLEESAEFCIKRISFLDCLQAEDSPLRAVLTGDPIHDLNMHSSHFTRTFGEAGQTNTPCAISIARVVDGELRRFVIDIHSVALQYNPSLVLAMQRFAIRLRNSNASAILAFPTSRNRPSAPLNDLPSGLYCKYEVSARLRSFSLRLNKERQQRSLVQLLVVNTSVDGLWSNTALEAKAKVDDLRIMDSDTFETTEITDSNRFLLRMSDQAGPCMEIRHISFLQVPDGSSRTLPKWGLSFIRDQDVDDVLEMTFASMHFVFLNPRTTELIDYLSKSLPQSPAPRARLAASQRRSRCFCLNFRMEKASLYVPRNATADGGLVLRCDVLLRIRTSADPVLELEGSMTDLFFKVHKGYGDVTHGERMFEGIEVLFLLQTSSAGRTKAKCGVSDVQARICYTDYVHLMQVAHENIWQQFDKTDLDEPGYDWTSDPKLLESTNATEARDDLEQATAVSEPPQESCQEVANAEATSRPFELTVAVSDVAIVLRRNDASPESVVDYDMVLFRGEHFDFILTSSSEGETAVFSVKRIFAFDLGEQGRVLRSTRSLSAMEVGPMPIAIMVEGYSSSEQPTSGSLGNGEDTQIMARLDRPRVDSRETRISVVISRLSITALFRPLQELAEFSAKAWTIPVEKNTNIGKPCAQTRREDSQTAPNGRATDKPHLPVSIRVVLHYPRIMFVADDGDPHSRALILRGLALVNASLGVSSEQETQADTGNISLVTVNGDFQNISSYIRPDVADVLFAKDSYRMHIEDVLSETSPYIFLEDSEGDGNVDEPVALLLPVTMGVEFEQRSRDSIVYQRSVALNMDPVSLMISAEDLQLIRLLAKKWSSAPTSRPGRRGKTYDVVFRSQRLGIGLRKLGAKIIVDAIHEQPIGIGDSLVGINGEHLHVAEASPLSDVVERLKNGPRPLRLTFSPIEKVDDGVIASPSEEARVERKHGYRESADISLANASITLIGNEVPILRGIVSTTQMNVVRKDGNSLDRQLAFSSVVAVDYYNLRIWGWEPLMEPGSIKLSADMCDPVEGSRTLILEACDCVPTPISFNVTDACASAISKLLKWDTSPEFEPLVVGSVFVDEAKKAANAALRFAKQQRSSGSKPFLLQNESGISCAFVVQKKSSAGASDDVHASFDTVGDYSGLQNYDSSDISEIPAGGECKFRLDRGAGSRQTDGHGRVPSLTVAFQSVSGVTLDPLVDLQIVRSGVTLLPLSCNCDGRTDRIHKTVWVSWTVDPRDEMTVLKLSSTFRILSLLHTQLELGLEPEESGHSAKSLGVLPVNSDYFLPLWLCLQTSFKLSIRPVGERAFSPLFAFSEVRTVADSENQHVKYVECLSHDSGSTWLAASKEEDTASTSITIDCILTLLNMLPLGIEWEVSKSEIPDPPIDGSTVRQLPLKSGESAEILGADDQQCCFRVKWREWSQWLSLETMDQKIGDTVHIIRLADVFDVPLDIGARIARKTVGFRVTLFAELWFLNATTLDISFGVSADSIQVKEVVPKDDGQDDISTAEAALKEISSLFESGDNGRGIRNNDSQDDRTANMLLLPSNGGTVMVQECFEYMEVQNTQVVRWWWASSDPLSTVPNSTLIEEEGEDWSWVDSKWVSLWCIGARILVSPSPSLLQAKTCADDRPFRRDI